MISSGPPAGARAPNMGNPRYARQASTPLSGSAAAMAASLRGGSIRCHATTSGASSRLPVGGSATYGTPAATPSIGVAALSVRISPPLVRWTEFWQTLRIARGIAGIRLIDRDKAAVDLPQMRQAIHLPEPLACLRRLLRGGFLEGQECERESCSNDSRNSSPPAGDTRFLWRRPAR